MLRSLALAIALVSLAAPTVSQAQDGNTPGVTEIAPGVREIDGTKVPSLRFEAESLEVTLKEEKSFRKIKKLLGGEGIASVGPGGTTTHMYKVLDTTTAIKWC
ncbi:MAG: hypothetical protein CGW95_01355 [Phenylobacterium zucineum]|nr:MAG: hypothetical protein CGW95_01355 [Phenylobacterium zucineum]